MGIEGNRRSPEDPFGKGIEASGYAGAEFTPGFDTTSPNRDQDSAIPVTMTQESDPRREPRQTCVIVLPFQNPRRFGHGRTEIAIPGVPVVHGNYDGFKAAMELGGFREYSDTESTVRMPTQEGIHQTVLTPGDFQRVDDAGFNFDTNPESITFQNMVAERYLMERPLGWGNFLILREKVRDDRAVFTLVDLQRKMIDVVRQYPIYRIATNPYSPYLPTDKQ